MSKIAQISDAVKSSPKARAALLEKARALVPALRERASKIERLRRLHDDTVLEFHESALFRVVQPARVGGSELDVGILIDVCAQIARGCASSAWVLGNLANHHWTLALFAAQAQDEVWGDNPDALIASSFVFPAGHATEVDGGYRLSGHWPFCSGVDFCQWNLLGATVEGDGEDQPGGYRIFLLPKAQYEVIDNWFVAGLIGTGSKEVAATDVFVPAYRTLAMENTRGGSVPGAPGNPGALYKLPLMALFPYSLCGVALGNAEAAVDYFIETNRARVAASSGRNVADFQSIHMRMGEAMASIDAARLLMQGNCAQAMRIAEADSAPDVETKARWRRDAAFSTTLCTKAVDLLFQATGGGVLYANNPMQRVFRDAHAISQHIALTWDQAALTYGRVVMGLPCDNPLL